MFVKTGDGKVLHVVQDEQDLKNTKEQLEKASKTDKPEDAKKEKSGS